MKKKMLKLLMMMTNKILDCKILLIILNPTKIFLKINYNKNNKFNFNLENFFQNAKDIKNNIF